MFGTVANIRRIVAGRNLRDACGDGDPVKVAGRLACERRLELVRTPLRPERLPSRGGSRRARPPSGTWSRRSRASPRRAPRRLARARSAPGLPSRSPAACTSTSITRSVSGRVRRRARAISRARRTSKLCPSVDAGLAGDTACAATSSRSSTRLCPTAAVARESKAPLGSFGRHSTSPAANVSWAECENAACAASSRRRTYRRRAASPVVSGSTIPSSPASRRQTTSVARVTRSNTAASSSIPASSRRSVGPTALRTSRERGRPVAWARVTARSSSDSYPARLRMPVAVSVSARSASAYLRAPASAGAASSARASRARTWSGPKLSDARRVRCKRSSLRAVFDDRDDESGRERIGAARGGGAVRPVDRDGAERPCGGAERRLEELGAVLRAEGGRARLPGRALDANSGSGRLRSRRGLGGQAPEQVVEVHRQLEVVDAAVPYACRAFDDALQALRNGAHVIVELSQHSLESPVGAGAARPPDQHRDDKGRHDGSGGNACSQHSAPVIDSL